MRFGLRAFLRDPEEYLLITSSAGIFPHITLVKPPLKEAWPGVRFPKASLANYDRKFHLTLM